MEGLSHDEKKSSLGSPEGVDVPAVDDGAGISVTKTSSGYLELLAYCLAGFLSHILPSVGGSPLLELIFVFGGSV